MRLRRLFLIVIVMVMALGQAVYAASEPEEFDLVEAGDQIDKFDFEKGLEERLTKDVESYLGNNKFIFKIDAELTKTKTFSRKKVPSYPPPAQPQARAVKPENLSNESDSAGKSDDTIKLPGLPSGMAAKKKSSKPATRSEDLDIQQTQTPQTPSFEYQDELTGTKTNVKKLSISLVLDKSATTEQEEFIKNLVHGKAQIDTIRGDTLQITRADFPKAAEPVKPSPSEPLSKYSAYLPYTAAILLILLIIAVILALSRKSDRQMPSEMPPVSREATPPRQPEPLPTAADGKKGDIDRLRQEIVALGLGQPDIVNARVRFALENDGMEKVALLYRGIGFNLARSLFSSIKENDLAEIKKQIGNSHDVDDEEVEKFMSDFYNDTIYDKLSQSPKKADAVRPFGFLDDLNDAQIRYLLEEEESKIKAVVLSQLPSARTASIIKSFPQNVMGQVAVAMGGIQSVPVSALQEVAERLSKKAVKVPSFDNITSDGIGLLVDVFDNLDGVSEKSLLEMLRTQNPGMYQKLKRIYFTFSDIPKVPKNYMREILMDVDRKTIVFALLESDAAVKSHILASLPERMRVMVEDEIENIGKSYTPQNIDEGRMAIVKKIRFKIKKEGIAS